MKYKVRNKEFNQIYDEEFASEYEAYINIRDREECDKQYMCYEEDEYEIIEIEEDE